MDAVDDVRDRVEKANLPKPSVYIELDNNGPEQQGASYGDYMWGKIADVAGGRNITRDVVKTWGAVAPEQILAARPDVIILSGSEWRKHPTGQLMGEGVTSEEARKRLDGFAARPGWTSLPADKNERVYAVYRGDSRTIMDCARQPSMSRRRSIRICSRIWTRRQLPEPLRALPADQAAGHAHDPVEVIGS